MFVTRDAILIVALLTLVLGSPVMSAESKDETKPKSIATLWNFNDLEGTEAAFLEFLKETEAPDLRAEILTQIARTYSLRKETTKAHQHLDEAEKLIETDMHRARMRLYLERGRTYNNKETIAKSIECFEAATALGAQHTELESLYIDALHMLGIVHPPKEAIEWNKKAIAAVEQSSNEKVKGWLGPLYNNTAWSLYDLERYEEALALFTKDRAYRQSLKRETEEGIAWWSMARTLRALGRTGEALKHQYELLKRPERKDNDSEGYGHEEIAECLLTLGKAEEATPHFKRAWELLHEDKWLQKDEPERLARLKKLGGLEK